MAIGVYIHSGSMTTAQYDQVVEELAAAGAGRPAGRAFHCSFGPPDNLMIFDIWDSQQAFDEFGKVLLPIIEQAGLDLGKPDVLEIHNMIF